MQKAMACAHSVSTSAHGELVGPSIDVEVHKMKTQELEPKY
jgi:hypothetical protein